MEASTALDPQCTRCELYKNSMTVCLGGKGPVPAKVMLIGQGPGSVEDLHGEPFIGPSGKLLDGMLADAGFDPKEIFITNAVKCRTRDNEAPLPMHIDACRQYLKAEIHAVKPEVIIAAGDVALRALCKLSGVQSKRGQSFPLHREFEYVCEVYPTYHSAYVLRVPNSRDVVVADFRRVRDRATPQSEIKWQYLDFAAGDPACFPVGTREYAYDIETFDEDGNITSEPTQAAVSGGGITLVSRPRVVDDLLLDLPHPSIKIISHFGWDFDDKKTGIQSDYDTACLAYLDDETQPLALESLCVKYLPGVRGWKEARENAPLGSDALAEYNARDAVNTLKLFYVLKDKIGPRRMRIAEEIILPLRLALNACSERGIWIDGPATERLKLENAHRRDMYQYEARHHAAKAGWAESEKLNVNAPQQVAAVLESMGYFLPMGEKSGKPSSSKTALNAIDHPFVDAVEKYRSAARTVTTLAKYQRIAEQGDGRAHPTYTVIRTVVGRTSAREPNVQNPDRAFKDILFSAPPGKVFVTADYNALHFRLAAWCANETSIIERYQKDPLWDPHRFFAARFYDTEEDSIIKTERQIAKSANFSQLYLGDAHTLQDYAAKMGITIPLETCIMLHNEWHETFPEFRPWYARVTEDLRKNSYVESATGRRRHFGDVRTLTRTRFMEARREAVNFLVLGFEPDIAGLALSRCHILGLPINGFFHDAIGFEFNEGELNDDVRKQIRSCMIDEPVRILRERFDVDLTVPLEIEITEHTKEK